MNAYIQDCWLRTLFFFSFVFNFWKELESANVVMVIRGVYGMSAEQKWHDNGSRQRPEKNLMSAIVCIFFSLSQAAANNE